MRILTSKYKFLIKNSLDDRWTFWNKIKNSTLYRLYANGSPKGTLSNRGSGIAGIISRIEILNFVKTNFSSKIY